MKFNKRILAIIPARGGSKGLYHKNIRMLGGIHLIGHTILSALNSIYIDKVMVSTDDEEIASISREYGANVPFLRPSELAADSSKTIDSIVHAVEYLEDNNDYYDIVLVLQATSPLRDNIDIDNAIDLFFEEKFNSLVSVSEVNDNPILMRNIKNNKLEKIIDSQSTVRRQDMTKYYRVNGAIYINLRKEITPGLSLNDNKIGYIMDQSHSIDVDALLDLKVAELIFRSKNKINFDYILNDSGCLETYRNEIGKCLDFINNNDLYSINAGTYTISDKITVNIFTYKTDKYNNRRWEVHEKFIDLHYLIIGKESVMLLDINDAKIVGDYDEGLDEYNILKTPSQYQLNKNNLLLIHPGVAHITGIEINEPINIKKAVFKIERK